MKIDFPRIIQDLAVNLQQPLMDPVEDACRISWDDVDMYIYYHDEDNEDLVIVTLEIGEIPSGAQSNIYSLLLQANYLWIASDYATLSVNPETKVVTLCDKINAELVDVDKLTARVKQLYQTAVYWQGIVADESKNVKADLPDGSQGFSRDFAIKV